MQLDARHNHVVASQPIGEATNFSIEANAKMFRVLSDTMYQDKPGSIVRELSCNAVDAHIAAGKPETPFFIHIPNAVEPWFAVRDEGTGLSDEDIRAIYTSYGRSTKDAANDMIGAFGLGSKTPFAYTDQFNVTSIHDGMRRVYTAVLGDNGMPVLNLQHEEETDEHPGLEVHMGVRDGDYSLFVRAIREQLRFLPIKPTLLNNFENIEFADVSSGVLFENANASVYNGKSDAAVRQAIYVVQGGVGYPLNLSTLALDDTTKQFADALEQQGAVLWFDIGQIEVTASREGLSYTTGGRTIINVTKRLQMLASSLAQETMDALRAEKTLVGRIILFNDTMSYIKRAIVSEPDFEKLMDGSQNHTGYGYRGHTRSLNIQPLLDEGYMPVLMHKHKYRKRNSWNETTTVRRQVLTDDQYRRNGNYYTPESGDLVIIRDKCTRPVVRLKKFAEDKDYPRMFVIELATPTEIDAKEKRRIAKLAGVDVANVIMVSDMDCPKVTSSGNRADKQPRAYQMGGNHSNPWNSADWTVLYDDIDDLGAVYYVVMDRHEIDYSDDDTAEVLRMAQHGMVDETIIAVNRRTAGRIEEGKIGDELTHVKELAPKYKGLIEEAKMLSRRASIYEGFLSELRYGIFGDANRFDGIPEVAKVARIRERRDQIVKRIPEKMR